MTVNEALRRFRKDFDLSQKDLADVLGITRQSYNSYEKDAMPNSRLIIQLADHFNVTTDYLLGRSDNPNININVDTDIVKAALKFSAELNQILNRQNQ